MGYIQGGRLGTMLGVATMELVEVGHSVIPVDTEDSHLTIREGFDIDSDVIPLLLAVPEDRPLGGEPGVDWRVAVTERTPIVFKVLGQKTGRE